MQVLEKPVFGTIAPVRDRTNLPLPDQAQLVETYLGYQILLKHLWVSGVDKGLWLHWCHPQDVGCKASLTYGHFLPAKDMLPEILDRVKAMIEATVKAEATYQRSSNQRSPKPTPQPGLATWLKHWFK
jgi:hypothetical protein